MTAHLPVFPVLGPLLLAGVLLLVERSDIRVRRWLGLAGCVAWIAVAAALVAEAATGSVSVYLLGDWPARLGIALAVDRLSALMVLTTALLALPCLLYAADGWDARAPYFHAFFQLQLAGLFGAFLTADLFNLFVFFELLLIASYGIMLSGGRGTRMAAGMQYVAFNVGVSVLFLIAVGLLYGLTGTLNMAEMAARVAVAAEGNLGTIRAAAGVLLVVFCAKAALLPLYLWLPDTYARAPAAAAALFAVMTKLGIYCVLRVYTAVFGAEPVADVAWPWVMPLAIALLFLAALGTLASRSLRHMAAHLVLVSAATLFIAFALVTPASIAAGLYYLVHSALAGGALFLLADAVLRQRPRLGDALTAGEAVRQPMLLGVGFILIAVALVGLPPLPGFVGKLTLLAATPGAGGPTGWIFAAVLISSLAVMVAMARSGSQLFWKRDAAVEVAETPDAADAAPARGVHVAAVALLVAMNLALSVAAEPVLTYTRAAGEQLLAPQPYLDGVRGALPQREGGDE
ncbi:monovalent cation/H+ antiporter subunit D [Coralloluteibacterium thermophilus]|uniref:Monovalent cation/H+ antiporter subunit D n=1 Tax=Coralloluteibacterium thermophilum TaxID=2707049 RepID=A0ABV9NG98_9GAMM